MNKTISSFMYHNGMLAGCVRKPLSKEFDVIELEAYRS